MMLSVSHDADANSNDITYEKNHIATHFDCLDTRKSWVAFTMPLMSHDANAYSIT